MGNCTYVLVEERYVELDYAVYVTNYDCGRDVSCPGSINVVYKSEEVKVTVPDKNDLTTKLVSFVMDPWCFLCKPKHDTCPCGCELARFK